MFTESHVHQDDRMMSARLERVRMMQPSRILLMSSAPVMTSRLDELLLPPVKASQFMMYQGRIGDPDRPAFSSVSSD